MGKKVRSARGATVDFDLMKIKEQISSTPTPVEVRARQDFIENRLKRRIKKAQNAVVAPELPEPAKVVNETLIEEETKEDTKEPVSEALAAVEEEIAESVLVMDEETKPATKRRTTKQVARPKKTTTKEQEPE